MTHHQPDARPCPHGTHKLRYTEVACIPERTPEGVPFTRIRIRVECQHPCPFVEFREIIRHP